MTIMMMIITDRGDLELKMRCEPWWGMSLHLTHTHTQITTLLRAMNGEDTEKSSPDPADVEEEAQAEYHL
jgi:hypothetical protein